ncbi:MAG: hypothetical protein JXA99_08470 [Candidatus Lokiarchaeota archaeon]|nr:hypothetical protein [Candidatus Lokiarchaeota archaeon]
MSKENLFKELISYLEQFNLLKTECDYQFVHDKFYLKDSEVEKIYGNLFRNEDDNYLVDLQMKLIYTNKLSELILVSYNC